jgi:hypothetical protein
VHLATGAGGSAAATWYGFGMDGLTHAQVATSLAGGGWSVAQDFGPGWSPMPGVDDQGNVLALWRDRSGTVNARAYDAAGPDLSDLSIPPSASPGQALGFGVTARDRWSASGATHWSFGDGATADGEHVAHAFAAAGDYIVQVTAADTLGNTSQAARVVAVRAEPAPIITPPAPRPSLTVQRARLPVTFRRSHVKGPVRLLVQGHSSAAGAASLALTGPTRPAARRQTLSAGTAQLPAGDFSLRVTLPAKIAAKLLPGAYTLRLASADLTAGATIRVASPPEGVVMDARISTSRTGPNLLQVSRTKRLWATFRFAPEGHARKPLTAKWYEPSSRRAPHSFAAKGPNAFSFWHDSVNLTKGVWRCVLTSGRATVESVSIRVG